MFLDNPSTYSQKYGIILQLFRFNHNIQNLVLKKYKMMRNLDQLLYLQDKYKLICTGGRSYIGSDSDSDSDSYLYSDSDSDSD